MRTTIDRGQFGPWALVTGASSGIGAEFARQLAGNGLNLVLVARRAHLLEGLGRQLQQASGIQYRVIQADLSIDSAVDMICEATEDLDIGVVISNAGTGAPAEFIQTEEEKLFEIIRLNALSHFRLVHYFGKRLAKRGRGGLLLTGAMGASGGIPYMANESATKGFILSLGLALHEEFRKYGVHLTVLITPPTDTPVIEKLGLRRDKLPMKLLPVELCVSKALTALVANRSTVLPGRLFRIMNALVPASVSRNMSGKMFAQGMRALQS
jgi:short-subunit dehydrogenase